MYFKNFRTCKSACKYFSPMQLSKLCLHVYNAALFSPKRWQSIYSFQWILLCFQLEKWESEHLCMLSQPSRVLRTIAHQAPLSMDFWREHWTGLPFPPPGESFLPRDWTRVSCSSYIADGFFKAETFGKLKGNESISYLQGKVITQR